jgi:hypothetical protein
MLAEPTIGDPLRLRYRDVLDGPYAEQAILELFDAMVAEVHDSALRDEEAWGEGMRNYPGWNWRSDFLTHEEEVAYARDWIRSRWSFVRGVYLEGGTAGRHDPRGRGHVSGRPLPSPHAPAGRRGTAASPSLRAGMLRLHPLGTVIRE